MRISGCGSSRELRQRIALERERGAIICSGSGRGYWKPKNRQEIQEFIKTMDANSDNIPYAEESDFADDAFTAGKRSNVTPEKKQENHIPKIIPKKKKAPFNVEAFAKECNAYVIKQERQEEQKNLQH